MLKGFGQIVIKCSKVLAKGISSLEEAWMQSSTLTNTQVVDF